MAAVTHLGENVEINPEATINVSERLVIGDDSKISAGCVIEGRDIVIGNGFWMLPGAVIGGGSAFELQSNLTAGHFLHMGRNTLINTARSVVIGDEVGLGTGTGLFTHGAYLSALDGFPVSFAPITIGSRVWLPGATVNPGVEIGDDVVVGVGAVVTRSIPSGSLAMGAPAKVVREEAYPRPLQGAELASFWDAFLADWRILGWSPDAITIDGTGREVRVGTTVFDTVAKTIHGEATVFTEKLRDQLRRYGIRFYASQRNGIYVNWNR